MANVSSCLFIFLENVQTFRFLCFFFVWLNIYTKEWKKTLRHLRWNQLLQRSRRHRKKKPLERIKFHTQSSRLVEWINTNLWKLKNPATEHWFQICIFHWKNRQIKPIRSLGNVDCRFNYSNKFFFLHHENRHRQPRKRFVWLYSTWNHELISLLSLRFKSLLSSVAETNDGMSNGEKYLQFVWRSSSRALNAASGFLSFDPRKRFKIKAENFWYLILGYFFFHFPPTQWERIFHIFPSIFNAHSRYKVIGI